jgi:hypothetical protein
MLFEGGCAIVADLRRLKIRYCVRKTVGSATRELRQQAFAAARLQASQAAYFSASSFGDGAGPFAALHRGTRGA